jgi:capsid protein
VFLYPENQKALSRAVWRGPKLTYVVPDKEVAAADKAIALGISTRRDECARQGKDWVDVQAQLELEESERKKRGLGQAPAAGGGGNDGNDQGDKDDDENDEQPNNQRRAA